MCIFLAPKRNLSMKRTLSICLLYVCFVAFSPLSIEQYLLEYLIIDACMFDPVASDKKWIISCLLFLLLELVGWNYIMFQNSSSTLFVLFLSIFLFSHATSNISGAGCWGDRNRSEVSENFSWRTGT